MTVLIGMFLLGLFIALGTWTVSWSNHVKRELLVKIYFAHDASKAQETSVAKMLAQNQYVKPGGIVYVSKEQALKIMTRRYPDLAEGLTSNPEPDAFGGDAKTTRGCQQALQLDRPAT